MVLPVLMKHLVVGHFSFSLYFIGRHTVVNLPERIETGIITGSDQTVRAVHSCNSWFINLLIFSHRKRIIFL